MHVSIYVSIMLVVMQACVMPIYNLIEYSNNFSETGN